MHQAKDRYGRDDDKKVTELCGNKTNNFAKVLMRYAVIESMKKILCAMAIATFASLICSAGTMYKNNVVASYYADKFDGRKTASGEIFDMNGYTAAHKDLPFGTQLKVTNLANGKSVVVKVNDRGPFVAGREIDLSKAAAAKLDMMGNGTANVSIELVEAGDLVPRTYNLSATAGVAPSDPIATANADGAVVTSATVPVPTEQVTVSKWDIQLGAFTNKGNANILAQKLLAAGFTDVVYQDTGKVTRVAIKDVDGSRLEALQSELYSKGFTEQMVRRRK